MIELNTSEYEQVTAVAEELGISEQFPASWRVIAEQLIELYPFEVFRYGRKIGDQDLSMTAFHEWTDQEMARAALDPLVPGYSPSPSTVEELLDRNPVQAYYLGHQKRNPSLLLISGGLLLQDHLVSAYHASLLSKDSQLHYIARDALIKRDPGIAYRLGMMSKDRLMAAEAVVTVCVSERIKPDLAYRVAVAYGVR